MLARFQNSLYAWFPRIACQFQHFQCIDASEAIREISNIVVLYRKDSEGFHRLDIVRDLSKSVPANFKYLQLGEAEYLQSVTIYVEIMRA